MDPKALIRQTIASTEFVCNAYLNDLTDDELMHRPVEGANHINWQWGHLIASEHMLGQMIPGVTMPSLPEGFADKYSKEAAASDDASAFEDKATLLSVQQQQRQGLLAVLDGISDEALSDPAPEAVATIFPNSAAIILSADSHWMMHAGQWAIVRRSLGKPALF
ncbi:DinB superfamily protein [Rubripirellula lacrimiformis]|uniref:DinB superfamily protein n=1 Tax=Rubripirellula lacrimiformis TaxID=1930273 RepID=A0A517N666_9BACT|nr:DinB family protein [Rubripirellula lacrimiformis]QDT02622.1 DinB superfamily protein [Rubripirellula lacrimiformis]